MRDQVNVPALRAQDDELLPPAVVQLAQAMAEGLARARHEPVAQPASLAEDGPALLVDAAVAARLLGVGRMTIYRACDEGRVPCVIVARGSRQKTRRVPRAFITAVAKEALAAGGPVDLEEFAARWIAQNAQGSGPAHEDPVAGGPALAVAGGLA